MKGIWGKASSEEDSVYKPYKTDLVTKKLQINTCVFFTKWCFMLIKIHWLKKKLVISLSYTRLGGLPSMLVSREYFKIVVTEANDRWLRSFTF